MMWSRLWSLHKVAICFGICLVVSIFVVWVPIVVLNQGTFAYWKWDASTWQAVTTGLAGLALIFLATLTWQLQVRAVMSATRLQVMNRLDEINRLLIENGGLLVSLNSQPDQTINFTDPRVHLMDAIFSLYEDVYLQYKQYGFLKQEVWESYARSMVLDIFGQWSFAYPYWEKTMHDRNAYFVKAIGDLMEIQRAEVPSTG